ncbi:hypothetical protein F442_15841 [Phytophthora nicotianae P10297]|uniref:Uncharacterized protein n=1 Tax=Phytophthora nicotianae P10297 TaxID=1317064 RepID=W2YNA7_PHYNI|nr:hypothetical protein F442_15841 [Phytophthora nicotianae P10297]
MDDWVDPKAFRKLWNKLIKSGWKARQPTVLEVDYTFVKPGVVGKLRKNQRNADNFIGPKELWKYATREGLVTDALQHDAAPPPKKPPMGKLAAYAAAKQRAKNLQPMPGVVWTANAEAATEQGATVISTAAAATEQGAAVTSRITTATEQEGVMGGHSSTATSRKQGEFHEEPTDDINVAVESFAYGAESEDDEETFDEAGNDEEEYADEVESDPVFDDESGVFQQDDAAMRGLGESGWKIYDQDHCANLSLGGADLYMGRWGITKSAAAFAN